MRSHLLLLLGFFCKWWVVFFVAVFKILLLSLASTSLTMICLAVDRLAFILLVWWAWYIKLFIKFGKILAIISLKFFLLLSLFSRRESLMVLHISLRPCSLFSLLFFRLHTLYFCVCWFVFLPAQIFRWGLLGNFLFLLVYFASRWGINYSRV